MSSSSSSSSIFSNNNNRAGRRLDEDIKKGPWKAEEDEVLMKHVSKYGPRDWSSIRSNGLLRRTGKSCRLRWVNKLRPDLKNGCKFSAEEERIVIELQQHFGNKWARIATFLPGRTDNDVKNFWSSRKKRLARALQAELQKQSNSADALQNEPSCSTQVDQSSYVHQSNDLLLPDMMDPCLIECYDPAFLQIQFEMMEPEKNPMDADRPCPAADFPIQVPFAPMVPLTPESQELAARLENGGLAEGTGNVEVEPEMTLLDELPPPNFDFSGPPDGFFDDFPADMFDHIESLPSPSNW